MRHLISLVLVIGFVFCAHGASANDHDRLNPGAATAIISVERQIAALEATIAAKKAQLRQLKKQQSASLSAKSDQQKASTAAGGGDFKRFQKIYVREGGYAWEKKDKEKPVRPDPCNPQRLFIRANSLDNYLYGITPANKAKGASVNWTDDRKTKATTAKINGMISYVLLRDLCPVTPPGDVPFISGYALAPFVLGNGALTHPQSKKEQSIAKFGAEAQLELSRMIVQRQVFTLAPYYLTDFRGEAVANGLDGYWDLYDATLHLGGYINNDPNLGWFVQLRGEVDARHVSEPGLTNLKKADYAWVGGTARLNMFFFPFSDSVPEFLQNRLSLIASANWFRDLKSGLEARKYVVTLAYKLSAAGNSAIAFEYSKGTDKDSLVKADQYVLKLTYAY